MMTLLTTQIAAIIVTIIWYTNIKARCIKIGMFFYVLGASLMWLIDAILSYVEERVDCFIQSASEMLNDSFLGVPVIAFELTVWGITILVKDPKNSIE